MQLESARHLKATLTASLNQPEAIARRARALGVSARPLEAAVPPRSLAMGITRKGTRGFALAVRLQRRSLEGSPEVEKIRKAAGGEVEVRYVGRAVKRALPWYQRRVRPLRIGSSVGHFNVTAGSLGCFVTDASEAVMILSNNHVLADENRCKKGDGVLQPGTLDEGEKPGDGVAELLRFVRLKRVGTNLIDCAVASLADGIAYDDTKLTGLGNLAGLGDPPDEGTAVAKVGRTTGVTRGRVTAFEIDNFIVEFDLGDLRFDNQIEIEGAGARAFSDGGDSGSLIVDGKRRGVALLFAGTDDGGSNGKGLTYANPLDPVLSALKVKLLH